MVRILFLNIFGSGHVFPSLELVKKLINRGVQVTYFTHPRFGERIKEIGAQPMTYGEGFTLGLYTKKKAFPAMLFPGAVRGMLPIVLEFIEQDEKQNGPIDAIMFDAFAIAGYFASKILNKVAIRSSSSFPGGYSDSFGQFYEKDDADIIACMKELTEKYSLQRGIDFYAPWEDCLQEQIDSILSIVYSVEELQPQVPALSHGKYLYTGCSIPDELPTLSTNDENLIHEIKKWKEEDHVVVYISLGTVASLTHEFITLFVEAINSFRGKYKAVLTGFQEEIETELRDKSPAIDLCHFRCIPFAPQLHVLSLVDIFVSHCGMNSLNESLYFGVPIIAIPQQGEQLFNANAAKGAAIVLEKEHCSLHTLQEALTEIRNENFSKSTSELSTIYHQQITTWNNTTHQILSWINTPNTIN